jgi:hypothetical protein
MIVEAIKAPLRPLVRWVEFQRLPTEAKRQAREDHRRRNGGDDPGIAASVRASLDWIGVAQDRSRGQDGGVARHYSLVEGWAPSYPETTGYIVPTMIEQAKRLNDPSLRERAARMLDFLVSVQFPNGGFPGGMVGQQPQVPVTFNTGQILLGLAAGTAEWGDRYRASMTRAADWLATTQDEDGCWRKFATPFAKRDDKAYETHVSWGLFEAARVAGRKDWGEAGLKQVRWAIGKMRPNGWMEYCCLEQPEAPLTHTLGYALRGILEAWRWSGDDTFLAAARTLGDGLLSALRTDGSLPGRLRADWSAAVPWVCLTGNVQIAHCWLMLYQATRDPRYVDAGRAANAYVRRTIALDGPPETRGGVRGSYPIDGGYGTFEYLNWAAKFSIDSQTLEADLLTSVSVAA